MLSEAEFKSRLVNACQEVIAAEAELTDIDSHFGDADHGVTMTKISKAILEATEDYDGSGIQALLDEAATNVMMINGGSAVPLWNTWLDAMQEAASNEAMDVEAVKNMFVSACEELAALSKAKVGDKTMMDTLIPATKAIEAYEGDIDGLFAAAAEAAIAGAEASKGFIAKFGRAKSYGDKTIGTPDAGATSMKYFFVGLAKK